MGHHGTLPARLAAACVVFLLVGACAAQQSLTRQVYKAPSGESVQFLGDSVSLKYFPAASANCSQCYLAFKLGALSELDAFGQPVAAHTIPDMASLVPEVTGGQRMSGQVSYNFITMTFTAPRLPPNLHKGNCPSLESIINQAYAAGVGPKDNELMAQFANQAAAAAGHQHGLVSQGPSVVPEMSPFARKLQQFSRFLPSLTFTPLDGRRAPAPAAPAPAPAQQSPPPAQAPPSGPAAAADKPTDAAAAEQKPAATADAPAEKPANQAPAAATADTPAEQKPAADASSAEQKPAEQKPAEQKPADVAAEKEPKQEQKQQQPPAAPAPAVSPEQLVAAPVPILPQSPAVAPHKAEPEPATPTTAPAPAPAPTPKREEPAPSTPTAGGEAKKPAEAPAAPKASDADADDDADDPEPAEPGADGGADDSNTAVPPPAPQPGAAAAGTDAMPEDHWHHQLAANNGYLPNLGGSAGLAQGGQGGWGAYNPSMYGEAPPMLRVTFMYGFSHNKTFAYGRGRVVSAPAGSIKYTVEAQNWPFCSLYNSLKLEVVMASTVKDSQPQFVLSDTQDLFEDSDMRGPATRKLQQSEAFTDFMDGAINRKAAAHMGGGRGTSVDSGLDSLDSLLPGMPMGPAKRVSTAKMLVAPNLAVASEFPTYAFSSDRFTSESNVSVVLATHSKDAARFSLTFGYFEQGLFYDPTMFFTHRDDMMLTAGSDPTTPLLTPSAAGLCSRNETDCVRGRRRAAAFTNSSSQPGGASSSLRALLSVAAVLLVLLGL